MGQWEETPAQVRSRRPLSSIVITKEGAPELCVFPKRPHDWNLSAFNCHQLNQIIHLTGSHRVKLWPESCSKLPRKKCKLQSLCRRIARAQYVVYAHPFPLLAWVTPQTASRSTGGPADSTRWGDAP